MDWQTTNKQTIDKASKEVTGCMYTFGQGGGKEGGGRQKDVSKI